MIGRVRLDRWTAVVRWFNDNTTDEEVDVDAETEAAARRKVEEALKESYQPGGEIVRMVGPRYGLYL